MVFYGRVRSGAARVFGALVGLAGGRGAGRAVNARPPDLRVADIYLMGGTRGPMPHEFRPRADLPAWQLTMPVDWKANPFKDKNWRFHLHAWRMIDPLIKSWYRTRQPDLLREAFIYPQDWWRRHKTSKPTGLSWSDMVSGIRSLKLAFFLERRRLGDLRLTRRETSDLFELVDAHARFNAREENIGMNNHGLLQAIGYRQLCRQVPNRPACRGAEARSATYLRRLLQHQFTDEGIHREHSAGYHFYVTGLLADLRVAELFSDVGDVAEVARRATANRPWLVFPNGEVARIGDAGDIYKGKPLESAAWTHTLDGRTFAISDFSRSGYAIVRTLGADDIERQSMLIMVAMYHDSNHKQADDLSFELFERGQRILIDSGRYDFEWHPMRHYVYSAAAHNTVDLADAPIKTSDTDPYGSGLAQIEIDGEGFVLSGRVRRARRFDHARTLRYQPGRSLVIEDQLDSDQELTYASRLHFASNLTVEASDDGYLVCRGDETLATLEPPADAAIRLVRGQEDPLLGWDTIARRHMAPAHVLEAILSGKKRRIIWRVALLSALVGLLLVVACGDDPKCSAARQADRSAV